VFYKTAWDDERIGKGGRKKKTRQKNLSLPQRKA